LALGPPGEESSPARGETQIKIRRTIGSPQKASHHALPSAGRRDGFHLLIAALNGNYAPKNFGGKNRRIIVA
jgi:hypothetical protein